MNKQEIVNLEIERRALLQTVVGMSKGCDARMEVSLDEFLTGLEDKAKELQQIIDKEMNLIREQEVREIAHIIWLENGSLDGELIVHHNGKSMKLKEVYWQLAETEWNSGPDF